MILFFLKPAPVSAQFAITIDASALDTTFVDVLELPGSNLIGSFSPPSSLGELTLPSGSYRLVYNSQVGLPQADFEVTAAGEVTFDGSLSSVLDWNTITKTLTVNGVTITIDASALDTTFVDMNPVGAFAPPSTLGALTLLPGPHRLHYNSQVGLPQVVFEVTAAGEVTFDGSLSSVLDWNTITKTLTVNGG